MPFVLMQLFERRGGLVKLALRCADSQVGALVWIFFKDRITS